MRKITVLRLDHRTVRDQRITSHVALTSRAFGANSFVYNGEKDQNMENSILDVSKRWGGDFSVDYNTKVKSFITNWKGIKIHLTMYGEPHMQTIESLNKYPLDDILIIVGGSKVPRYIYSLVDFNTSIGWQPHSEVAAIGILLYEINGTEYLYKKYKDAKMEIPANNSKSIRSGRFN